MRKTALALVFAGLAAPTAWAIDYLSVAEPATLYDAPSQKAKPLFAIAAGTPVEAVVSLDSWVKVRDIKGDLAWIEKRHLSQQRTAIVRTERAQVHVEADDKAPLVFEAGKDVVLEWIESSPAGWAQVRHRDGQSGFIKAGQVWGL